MERSPASGRDGKGRIPHLQSSPPGLLGRQAEAGESRPGTGRFSHSPPPALGAFPRGVPASVRTEPREREQTDSPGRAIYSLQAAECPGQNTPESAADLLASDPHAARVRPLAVRCPTRPNGRVAYASHVCWGTGAPQDSRRINSVVSSTSRRSVSGLSISSMSNRVASAPTSCIGWRIVVKGGWE